MHKIFEESSLQLWNEHPYLSALYPPDLERRNESGRYGRHRLELESAFAWFLQEVEHDQLQQGGRHEHTHTHQHHNSNLPLKPCKLPFDNSDSRL